MKHAVVGWILLGAVVLGAVGAVVVARNWSPRDPESAPDTAAETVTSDELVSAAGERVFLGHMSIGWNILDGLASLYADKGVPGPEVVQIAPGDPAPDLPAGRGAIVHAEIGINGQPLDKLANFDEALRGGLADEVDVAVLKLCFTDVTADTDVEEVFAAYRSTMEALERDYPDVRFLHTTVPLTTAPSGIKQHLKVVLRGDDNAARERYNALVREAYAHDLFDIAAAESTDADGTRLATLAPGWADPDREHLNAAGAAMVAATFLDVLIHQGAG